ncbi:MAG: alpha/beta hydrolase [Bacteroidales bacterium]
MQKQIHHLILILLMMGGHLSQAQIPQVSSGSIVRLENFPSDHIAMRNVDVWLPENYDETQKYAVLYMHDGQMLFDSSITWNRQEWGVDETVSRLIGEREISPCIVVGIWNSDGGRHADYFPQKPFESLPQDFQDSLINEAMRYGESPLFDAGVRSDAYLKFIVTELKPYIDNRFSTRSEKEHTFVMGSSMGGLISMYAICEYPEIFGGAACLSTHWTGTFTAENNPIPQAFFGYLRQNLPDPRDHKIYFDYGTETLDALYEPFQQQADRIMESKGYDSQNRKTLKFEGADHSEIAWRERLEFPLIFLLGNQN